MLQLSRPKFQRLKFLSVLMVTYLIIQTITRSIMIISEFDSMSLNPLHLVGTFVLGIIYDMTAGVLFYLPIAILLIISKGRLLKSSVALFDFITIFIAVALFMFWREFHTNFNFIAVDYLIYTTEMLGTIWQSFNILLIVPAIIIATIIVFKLQQYFLPQEFEDWYPANFIKYVAIIMLLPILLVYFVQSSWREYVSDNRHNVEVAGNGAYEFVRAFFANELDYQTFYVTESDDVVINRLREMVATDNSKFFNDKDITRYIDNTNNLTAVKPNIVLITVESLNADYSAVFGAEKTLTPYLDELAKKSYIFTRMYATGTRTVRGLESLSLSLPPTPGQSIIRRQNNDNLATLGDVLYQNGYISDFIYGGYGYFDNMNTFFAGNGYNVKDRTDIPDDEIVHETIWGVADEILFTQVIKSMDEHFNKGESAFEMVMTTSNHRPFTFPEGRIAEPSGTRPAAVLYTDWSIHDFLERAATKPWFDNTVFVIIADHQALAAGKMTLPVNCYHIPCLIYAPKLIYAGSSDRLISQMDLPPTLLGMLGISYISRFLGQDINRVNPDKDHAFISTYQMLGYIKGDTLTILTPDKKINSYHIDNWNTSKYTPISTVDNDIVTWYQGASYLFKNNLLRK